MEFEKIDQDLQALFKNVSLKETHKTVLDSFETEVMERVRLASWIPVFRYAGLGILILSLAGLIFMTHQKHIQITSQKPVVPITVVHSKNIQAPVALISDAQIEQISEEVSKDMLLLQMLGEDEEFTADFKLMDSDMEILAQPHTSVV